jgi:superfamily II DNA or RNA helicase
LNPADLAAQSPESRPENPFGKAALLNACQIEFDEDTLATAEAIVDAGRVGHLQWNGTNTLCASCLPELARDSEDAADDSDGDGVAAYHAAGEVIVQTSRVLEQRHGATAYLPRADDALSPDDSVADPASQASTASADANDAEGMVEQQIVITRGRENLSLRGACTCEERRNCCHVAAAILSWVRSDEQTPVDHDAVEVWRDALLRANAEDEAELSEQPVVLLYRIRQIQTQNDTRFEVAVYSARRLRSGDLGKSSPLSLNRRSFDSSDLSSHDARICNALIGLKDGPDGMHLHGENGYMIFRWMVESRCCYYEAFDREPLTLDENRTIEAQWNDIDNGQRELKMNLHGSKDTFVSLPTDPPWYVIPASARAGVIDTDVPSRLLARLPSLPPVAESLAMQLSELMVQSLDSVDLPLPAAVDVRQIAGVLPRGVVILSARKDVDGTHRYAQVMVEYDGARLPHMMALKDGREILHRRDDGGFVRVLRSADHELGLMNELTGPGLPKWVSTHHLRGGIQLHVDAAGTRDTILWQELIDGRLAELRRNGWIIEKTPEFEYRIVTSSQWQMHIDHSADNKWFDLDLNFIIDGKPFALIPVLAAFLERVGSNLSDILNDPEATANVWLDEETLVEFPVAHIKPVLEVLVELQDHEDGKLRFSELQATVISDIAGGIESVAGVSLDWDIPARLAAVVDKLKSFKGIEAVAVPGELTAELRDYQCEGLNWLQFLREFGFSGILADDMGLGKTVQALATILVEKQSGRMTGPSLVVAPTSLMGNWRREAEKFAPNLKVLLLHGTDRLEQFDSLEDYDIVLTTYALVTRDSELHLATEYHYLILDEAQAIKNPTTKQAKIVCELRASHKLCLTGTPVENHLGEVWSQFRFLMPGFFGDQKKFNRVFRNPIEKSSEALPSVALQKRLRPFILRRSKDAVASELPAKTEIVQRVSLHPDQAVLYEGIRASMEVRVRRALAESGLGQSHITVLDALLRLRQTCLDPRLVKMSQARSVHGSAKLDALMEMLPNFVEEGRRVLLFSQFTEMLGHIEQAVKDAGISYTMLTGKTRKRDEAIDEFQSGSASVFLISLKAGGTGLNLTTADTVILYDPWWNPAVENQAIDRAHRIGQDKPVFVYRIITEQTVEEKILELQRRKKALADLVTENAELSFQSLEADDILDLFSQSD